MRVASQAALVGLPLMVAVTTAIAEQLPKWELGVGAAALSLPEYPGSGRRETYLLPLPYVAYRLDWLKADREGLRSRLIHLPDAELNLSASADPPVRSDASGRRAGMPTLHPTVQAGPALDWTLAGGREEPRRLYLHLPVRAVFTVSRDPQYAGVTFSPTLTMDFVHAVPGDAPSASWRLGLAAGPMFADHRQNAYYYSVDPAYASPARPAYVAPGGYAGSQALLALSRSEGDWWVGAYARLSSLHGASFAHSPLVAQSSGLSLGMAVTVTIDRSTTMVEAGR